MRLDLPMRIVLLFLVSGILFFSFPVSANAVSSRSDNAKVTVLPQNNSLVPGRPMMVGFLMEMDKDWHTYWRNPGDSGYPTMITWDLPQGFTAGEIVWPYPHRLVLDPLTSYGYEGSTLLLSSINVPATTVVGSSARVAITMNWLECRIECVPGTAQFEFFMPVAQDSGEDPVFAQSYAQFKDHYPVASAAHDVQGYENESTIILELRESSLDSLSFFPYEKGVIKNTPQQMDIKTSTGRQLHLEKAVELNGQDVSILRGLMVSEQGADSRAREITVELQPMKALKSASSINTDKRPLVIMMFFAFLGGLILNLMPCVLPVLSIKILSLVDTAAKGSRRAFLSGCTYASGILVSFWFLAFFIITLKSAGHYVGWGFQFQSPIFIIFMSVLFFWLGLNLFGLFEVGTSLSRIENAVGNSFLLKNSFMNGVLATVVATPCTAPFMGAALGFALSQSALSTLMIFTALGLGLAFPYLVLSAFPQSLRFVPKPGPWMITLKRIFGFLFMATVVWLSWVLAAQRGIKAVTLLYVGLATIGVAGWVIGRFATLSQNNSARWRARLVAVALFLSGFFIAVYGTTLSSQPLASSHQQGAITWVEFSPQRLEEYQRQGKTVFIDFTAKWCLSCQVNERVALNHPKVVARFKEKGIIMMKADWTNYDKQITEAIEGYGKSGVPVYVIYTGDSRSEPIFLPELLTPGIVLDALERI